MSSTCCYYADPQSDGTYAVMHSDRGLIEDGFEHRSTALDFIADREDEDRARAEQEAADAEHDAIGDFLHALDRGDFGDLRIGPSHDRAESAFIVGLREAHAARAALTDKALVAATHRRGAALAQAA